MTFRCGTQSRPRISNSVQIVAAAARAQHLELQKARRVFFAPGEPSRNARQIQQQAGEINVCGRSQPNGDRARRETQRQNAFQRPPNAVLSFGEAMRDQRGGKQAECRNPRFGRVGGKLARKLRISPRRQSQRIGGEGNRQEDDGRGRPGDITASDIPSTR